MPSGDPGHVLSQKITHPPAKGPMISENQNSLPTGKDTGDSTNFRPLNRKTPRKRPLAQAFLDFTQRKLTGRKVQVTGREFQKAGNEQVARRARVHFLHVCFLAVRTRFVLANKFSGGERDIVSSRAVRRGFWRAHHEAWIQKELNQRKYCEAYGIPLKAFGNWRAKFKAEPQTPARKVLYAAAAQS
jgi:hypothetical protein